MGGLARASSTEEAGTGATGRRPFYLAPNNLIALTARTLLVAACLLIWAGCGTTASAPPPSAKLIRVSLGRGPCGKQRHPPARYDHVVWVVMENHAFGSVIGSSQAPYENALAKRCGLAANFTAEAHPSLPNYIAMTSGSTHGIADDGSPSSHAIGGPSIFSQLGSDWRALQESMPSNCSRSSSGDYAVKHNPAAYFTGARAACARQDVPLHGSPDLSAKFTFVTPNLCNDTHDCSVSTGDRWLRTFLTKVFATPEYRAGRTAVFLTWDEDDSGHGNHVATIVAAPAVARGTVASERFSHYSMLRTAEEMLGLRFIGAAAQAPSMRPAFGL